MSERVERHEWVDKNSDKWIVSDDGIMVSVEGRGWVRIGSAAAGREIAAQLRERDERIAELEEEGVRTRIELRGVEEWRNQIAARLDEEISRAEAAERKLAEAERAIRRLSSVIERVQRVTNDYLPPDGISKNGEGK